MSQTSISPFTFLEQVPEFQGLPKSDLNHLLSKSTLLEFSDGEAVFHEGDKAEYFYFVLEGKVSMGGCSKAGRESVNCIAGRKDLFCCLPALDMMPYPVTATAVGYSKVIRISIPVFQEICIRHPAIYQKFVIRICSNLRKIEQRHGQRMESAVTKVAVLLTSLSKQNSSSLSLTRAEIAKLVGITVETAIRTLSQMTKDKVISSQRGSIQIINQEKLFALAEIHPCE